MVGGVSGWPRIVERPRRYSWSDGKGYVDMCWKSVSCVGRGADCAGDGVGEFCSMIWVFMLLFANSPALRPYDIKQALNIP